MTGKSSGTMIRIVAAGRQKVQALAAVLEMADFGAEIARVAGGAGVLWYGALPGPKGVAMTEWYFVWVEGLRGPMPQKWSSDGLWGQIGRQDVIVRFALSDAEVRLPIDELAKRHPIPDRK
jgi:hypothetical protein